jgi:chromate transporter
MKNRVGCISDSGVLSQMFGGKEADMKQKNILWTLFIVFLKIGTFTFGGGLVMLPLIQKEIVEKRKWIEDAEIVDIFAISQSIPGIIAINSSVFIGKKVAGIKGAIVSAFAVSLPAFLSIILIISLFSSVKDNIFVGKALRGVLAAASALIIVTSVKLAKSSIKNKSGYIISLVSFLVIVVLNINAMWAIIAGILIGLATYVFNRRRK